jgi:hypothetical protein
MESLNQRHLKLKAELDNMDVNHKDYNALQLEVYNLMLQARDHDNTMEPRDYIPPSQYDVLLSDIGHNDLVGNISQRLNVTYLSRGEVGDFKSAVGILYGTNARPMVNLVVSSKRYKVPINVIFLVDTVSPALYVCDLAMQALGFTDNTPATFDLCFGGSTHEAVMSPLKVDGKEGHYKDINLIGATFLTKMQAKVTVDYKSNQVTLDF